MVFAKLGGVTHPPRRSGDCLGFGRYGPWVDGDDGGRKDATHQELRHISANVRT